ncbi:Repetin [Streptomyces massasporeus]|uniref:Repetin n=1 Tax=Streptomyces massasporeus TaxID=67324 RepID=UPI00382DFC2A
MKHRTKIAVLGLVLLLTAGVASAATAADSPRQRATASEVPRQRATASDAPRQREAAALTGTAKLHRSAGDDITFSFDAHLAAEDKADPSKATGTFAFSHYLNGEGARAAVKVDCLLTGGKVAVVSGVVTDSDLPGAQGKRVGVTVHDLGRHDRLGYSWASTGSPVDAKELPTCVSSAPFEKVAMGTGDFTVVPWQPEL